LGAALQSELESVAATAIYTRQSIELLKSVTPPSLEEVTKQVSTKSLTELADSQSVKLDESQVIESGSTTGEPHLL